jgi:hypothetical protein
MPMPHGLVRPQRAGVDAGIGLDGARLQLVDALDLICEFRSPLIHNSFRLGVRFRSFFHLKWIAKLNTIARGSKKHPSTD